MKFIITSYTISSCWYGRRAKNAGVKADELFAILSRFATWVKSVPHISHTLINPASETYPFTVHVKDQARQNSDFIFVLWLSGHDRSLNTLALKEDDPPGATADVKSHQVAAGYIPGFPLYFFIDTAGQKVYTVRADGGTISGRKQLDAAIRFFMTEHRGDMAESSISNDDGTTVITLESVDHDGKDMRPVFQTDILKKKSKIDEIVSQRSEIRKLVHSRNIAGLAKDEKRGIVQGCLSFFGVNISDDDISDSRRIRTEVDVRLTVEELTAIIARQGDAGRTERVGFRKKNEKSITWADTCLSRREVDIPIEATSGVFSAEKLLSGIEAIRARVVD